MGSRIYPAATKSPLVHLLRYQVELKVTTLQLRCVEARQWLRQRSAMKVKVRWDSFSVTRLKGHDDAIPEEFENDEWPL